jgi:hypothetical protein
LLLSRAEATSEENPLRAFAMRPAALKFRAGVARVCVAAILGGICYSYEVFIWILWFQLGVLLSRPEQFQRRGPSVNVLGVQKAACDSVCLKRIRP